MKKLIIIISVVLLGSCSFGKIETSKAIDCVKSYLNAVKDSNYEQAQSYYSDIYNETEPKEKRIEKMQKLETVMGKISSYVLIDSLREESYVETSSVNLTYRVFHTNVNSIEKFSIIKDRGEYRIIKHNVESENL